MKRNEECTGSRAVTATWLPENEPSITTSRLLLDLHAASENEPAEWTTPGQRRRATCKMDYHAEGRDERTNQREAVRNTGNNTDRPVNGLVEVGRISSGDQ